MDKEVPLLSVIVPVYNVERYLPKCLDSLLAQSYQNFELLLVDDGSTDGSWEVLRAYAERDPRVRIFQKENGGVSSARNFGLEQAEGAYIAFVDSDDWVSPFYLEGLYGALQEQHTPMAVCDFLEVEEGCAVEGLMQRPEPFETRKISVENCALLSREMGGQCWRLLASAEILKTIRFDQTLHFAEDTSFFMETFVKAKAFAYLDAPLYCYLKRTASATGQAFSMKQWDEITGWQKTLELVKNQPKSLQELAEMRLLMACAHVYYRMCGSSCTDPEKEAEVVRIARSHWKIARKIPKRLRRERGKVWMLLLCPKLGSALWHTAKKNQIKMR